MLRPDSQFGVVVRHPDLERRAWAVEADTDLIPSWINSDEPTTQTWEKTALEIAHTVTGNRTHSVDRCIAAEGKTIYVMKLTSDKILLPGFKWFDYGETKLAFDLDKDKVEAANPKLAFSRQAVQSYMIHELLYGPITEAPTASLVSLLVEQPGLE